MVGAACLRLAYVVEPQGPGQLCATALALSFVAVQYITVHAAHV